ncbi:MAG TPA: hypothetical protein VIA18_31525, partial [Polyangia bacterium]|nr:hypothetical protein [Polyangia bacterium]
MPLTMRKLVFVALVAGCSPTTAVVAGKTVPRIDLDFYGQPFAVEVTNAHPEPGSPSGGLRDFGGHVSGNVCGLELSYEIVHDGDKTKAIGYVDNNNAFESTIYVHDETDMTRKIGGRLAEQGGTIDLTLRKNHIYGVVGQRQFAFGRRGDQYIGWLKIRQSVLAKAVINGAESLWTMPPATQAVVLPALLTCYGDNIEDHLG